MSDPIGSALPQKGILGVLVASLLLTAFLETGWALRFHSPFPPLAVALSTEVTTLSDFLGIAAGYRRLTADIAWIQTLQFYGTPEEDQTDMEEHNGGGHYFQLLAYCQRVAQIDPYFTYVYYFGGGALGWNLGRWKEAEALLQQGVENNPSDFRLQQYLAAIAYEHEHDPSKLLQFLESFVNEPDCPNLLRSVLANVYKKQKQYVKAIKIWILVYDTGDPSYHQRAEQQIQELSALAHIAH